MTDGDRSAMPAKRALEDWAARAPSEHGPEQAGESAGGNPPTRRADPTVIERRTVLKVLAAAAAVPALGCEPGTGTGSDTEAAPTPDQPLQNPLSVGTPTDPDLLSPVIPWEMVLTEDEMRTVGALADVILPADDRSPSATQVGAHHFVNEWVSAPYDGQRQDLVLVRGGLIWLNTESVARFGAPFADLDPTGQREICDDICYLPQAAPEHRAAARFFDKIRDLVSTGFWTTPEGMADLGYVGNVPLATFDGPPPEVLERLGLS